MKKIWVIPLALVTIVIMILSFLYIGLYINQVSSKDYYIKLKYSVKVVSKSPDNVSFYLPVPLKEGGKPSDVVGNIQKLHGECYWHIIDTQKGTALSVNGKGNISLAGTFEMKQKRGVYEYDAALSMAENRTSNFTVWIWNMIISEPITVNVTFEKSMGSIGSSSSSIEMIESHCLGGWEKIKVYVQMNTT